MDILHYYIELLRGGSNASGFHNIINVMKNSRRGRIYGECFDGIDLKNEPLCGIEFSDKGKNMSTFRGCRVSRNCFLSGHSGTVESLEFVDENTLISMSANEVIVWDTFSGVPVSVIRAEDESVQGKVLIENDPIKGAMRYARNAKVVALASSFYDEMFKLSKLKSGKQSKLKNYWLTRGDYDPISEEIKKRLDELLGLPKGIEIKPFYEIVLALTPKERLLDTDFFDERTKRFYDDLRYRRIMPLYANFVNGSAQRAGRWGVYFDRTFNRLYKCDLEDMNAWPQVTLDTGEYISFEVIENSECILYTVYKSTNAVSCIHDLDTDRSIYTPNSPKVAYLPELDCFFIKPAKHAELRRRSDGALAVSFPGLEYLGEKLALSVSKDKKYLAVACEDFGIDLFEISTGRHVRRLGGNTAEYIADIPKEEKTVRLSTLSFSRHRNMLWDIPGNRCICHYESGDRMWTSPDGSALLLRSAKDSTHFRLIDTGSAEVIAEYELPEVGVSQISWKGQKPVIEFLEDENSKEYFVYDGQENTLTLQKREFNSIVNGFSSYLRYYLSRNLGGTEKYYDILEPPFIHYKRGLYKTYQYYNNDSAYCYSFGWTLKLPLTKDKDAPTLLIYLLPELNITGCDFSGCELDDVTVEIIRQYNGRL